MIASEKGWEYKWALIYCCCHLLPTKVVTTVYSSLSMVRWLGLASKHAISRIDLYPAIMATETKNVALNLAGLPLELDES